MEAGIKERVFAEIAAISAACVVAAIPAPDGLEQKAMWVLALMVWAIINWITKAMEDYIVILLMCCVWVVLGIVPFQIAFGSFSSTTIWLLIAAMGIGCAVTKSGLLQRAALMAMRLCPADFRGQSSALLLSGICVGPLIPSTTAKVTIMGSVATGIGEMLGYGKQSKGMAGLWCAMYTGYTLLAPVCLNASFHGYIIYHLMPADVQKKMTFGYWMLGMLPWGILCGLMGLFLIMVLYRPSGDKACDRQKVETMYLNLGPMVKDEKVTLAILLGCVCLWIMEQKLGIPAAVTAILGLCFLSVSGILTRQDFENRIPWGLIVFMGGAINLASVITEVKIDQWIGRVLGPVFTLLAGRIYLFLPVVAIAVLVTRFLIVDMATCYSLFILVLLPVCREYGISPWLVGMASYVVVMPWFAKYQNTNFLAAFQSAGGENVVRHRDLIPYCIGFHVAAIVCLCLCIPYWRWLGLA